MEILVPNQPQHAMSTPGKAHFTSSNFTLKDSPANGLITLPLLALITQPMSRRRYRRLRLLEAVCACETDNTLAFGISLWTETRTRARTHTHEADKQIDNFVDKFADNRRTQSVRFCGFCLRAEYIVMFVICSVTDEFAWLIAMCSAW